MAETVSCCVELGENGWIIWVIVVVVVVVLVLIRRGRRLVIISSSLLASAVIFSSKNLVSECFSFCSWFV